MLARLQLTSLCRWIIFTNFLLAGALSLPALSSLTIDGNDQKNLSDGFSDYCFEPSLVKRLVPANPQDCTNAAIQMLKRSPSPANPITFARSKFVREPLPWVLRNGTCVISWDVPNDDDRDMFTLGAAFTTALGLINSCVDKGIGLGGKMTVGPRKVVTLMVFGRRWPAIGDDENSEHSLLNSSEVESVDQNPGAQIRRDVLSLPMVSGPTPPSNVSRNDAVPSAANVVESPLVSGTPTLGGPATCFDPPTQREWSFPINAKDCDLTTIQIIGDRNKFDFYTFSRRASKDPYHYQLPAKFTYGSCKLMLDMDNAFAWERVRLTFVESSAWVLAHKCSGEENPRFRYGGTMTVSVGANDLIRISVYNPSPPQPSGTPVLSLAHNYSSVDVQ